MTGVIVGGLFAMVVSLVVFVILQRLAKREQQEREDARAPEAGRQARRPERRYAVCCLPAHAPSARVSPVRRRETSKLSDAGVALPSTLLLIVACVMIGCQASGGGADVDAAALDARDARRRPDVVDAVVSDVVDAGAPDRIPAACQVQAAGPAPHLVLFRVRNTGAKPLFVGVAYSCGVALAVSSCAGNHADQLRPGIPRSPVQRQLSGRGAGCQPDGRAIAPGASVERDWDGHRPDH